jgi:hypothetical protein
MDYAAVALAGKMDLSWLSGTTLGWPKYAVMW